MSGGNLLLFFSYLMLVALIVSGLIVFYDVFIGKQRKRLGWEKMEDITRQSYEFFPVLLLIMILRTYLYEPFTIPSQSMYPRLTQGDVIAVSKLKYDFKFPFTNYSLAVLDHPARGDVAVFKYPLDTSYYFVKRVIGLPGDRLRWVNDDLYINGKQVERSLPQPTEYRSFGVGRYHWETLGQYKYLIRRLRESDAQGFKETSPFVMLKMENASYSAGKPIETAQNQLELTIPDNYYLMMGDNRDESQDSRMWGLVHRDLMVGHAQAIIVHVDPQEPWYLPWKKISFKHNALLGGQE